MSTDGPEPPDRRRWFRCRIAAAVVGAFSLVTFSVRLEAEPSFADEWAYVSQAYYGPLWWRGAWDDPAWLEYPAVDLPPLPKYLIAAMLRLGDQPMPDRADSTAWYGDVSTTFGGTELLAWARLPTVVLGVIGCLAAFAIGTMAFGPGAGTLAGLLLAIDPLYRMHARRAMSDVPAESFTLLSLAVGLWAWRELLGGRRPRLGAIAMGLGAGAFAGLATLAKLSGGLATMVLAAWAALALVLPGFEVRRGPNTMGNRHRADPEAVPIVFRPRRRLAALGSIAVAGAVAYATFIVGNPTLTANPDLPAGTPEPIAALADEGLIGRTFAVLEHRATVSRAGQENPIFEGQGYPLTGPVEKLGVVAVQGFGRFGPLGPASTDSLVRYDWEQDRGAILWGPLVLAGVAWAGWSGRRQLRRGEPPAAWAVLVQFVVAAATVSAFIPLAWDRYLLPIQSGAALLASGFLAGAIGEGWRAIRGGRRGA